MRLAKNGRSIVRFSEEKGTRKAKLNQLRALICSLMYNIRWFCLLILFLFNDL